MQALITTDTPDWRPSDQLSDREPQTGKSPSGWHFRLLAGAGLPQAARHHDERFHLLVRPDWRKRHLWLDAYCREGKNCRTARINPDPGDRPMRKTFIYNGCTVTAFRASDDGILPAGEWCL